MTAIRRCAARGVRRSRAHAAAWRASAAQRSGQERTPALVPRVGFLEGDGDGGQAPVELGQGHLHRHIQGRSPAARADHAARPSVPIRACSTGTPRRASQARAPALCFRRLLQSALLSRPHRPGGEAEGADEDVDQRAPVRAQEVALQHVRLRAIPAPLAPSWESCPGWAEAGAEDGEGVHAGAVEGRDDGVHEVQVPAQQVGAVEEEAGAGAGRCLLPWRTLGLGAPRWHG